MIDVIKTLNRNPFVIQESLIHFICNSNLTCKLDIKHHVQSKTQVSDECECDRISWYFDERKIVLIDLHPKQNKNHQNK